ncbi:serine/threonine-protein phosphatase 6 regulatory ankyrin repeat subunit C-like [Sycon ciliatum]|uniref:serine/threonine-protein phosphatase 6 regulatory ankyrin repeat subunit C-like n=1 Tax=Sycon ciliatum TaxID=27933 RepID=UPI0031F63A48
MATETLNKAEYLLSLVKRNDHQELKKEILQEDGTLKEGVEELTCTNDIGEEETLLGRLLFCACNNGWLECACILADCCGETVINQLYLYDDEWRYTPLHRACIQGYIDIAKYLVKCKANVDETGWLGRIPVHDAAYAGSLEVVKYLLELHPETVSAKDKRGELPVHLAAYNGKLDVVKCLLDLQPDTISVKNNHSNLLGHEDHCASSMSIADEYHQFDTDSLGFQSPAT